jgi:hypothetical protein
MTHDTSIAVMAIAVCGSIAVIVRSMLDAAAKFAEGRRRQAPAGESVSDARLARLEVAVESIAVEVERISEGQRFTTKLLNDQAQRAMPTLNRPGRVDTPH